MFMSRFFLLLLIFATACDTSSSKDTGIPDAFADADDTGETDADTDADGDADADGGIPYLGWEIDGRIDYLSTMNAAPDCDALIGFTGTSFVGECDGCDFAFRIDAEVLESGEESEECEYIPLLSLIGNGLYDDIILAHADTAYVSGSYYDYKIYDALQVGFSYYYGTYPGPYWFNAYYEGTTNDGSFSRDGNDIAWSFHTENTAASYTGTAYFDDCEEEITDDAVSALGGDIALAGTVPCDGWQADVWEITAPDAADFGITIDTVSDETTFDPAMFINSPVNEDEVACVHSYADDGFDCSYPPPAYECPAAEVTGDGGVYQVVVFSLGSCSAEEVEYTITATGAGSETLTLSLDDVDRFTDLEFDLSITDISACATIFEDGIPEDVESCVPDADADLGADEYTAAHGGTMVKIFAHTFEMGCTAGMSDCASDESPAHDVTLTNDFYIGETEVTQGEYEAMMGTNPSGFSSCGSDCPVETVTWHESAAFANAVSDSEGLEQCYTCTGSGTSTSCSIAVEPYSCGGYRLSTEAEWEAAARCGEDTLYAGSTVIDDVAWYVLNSDSTTHTVATKASNACGLYDMTGNVFEWTQDWYSSSYYSSSPGTDPVGATSGVSRVLRGASWNNMPTDVRVANRSGLDPPFGTYSIGLRLLRTSP
jgi:formylglycine-generating enzyme required for sulfatase activity